MFVLEFVPFFGGVLSSYHKTGGKTKAPPDAGKKLKIMMDTYNYIYYNMH